jgi:biopolymer transport protein ExbD
MRRSYQTRKLERHARKPAELLLVPMIDIFTVLVTFLLMTAVFSRTVILQLNLPPQNTTFKEPPPGLQLEVMVRKDLLQVADRNSGPTPACCWKAIRPTTRWYRSWTGCACLK